MRDRVDRRYALLLGVLLAAWAVTNDLGLQPPDLGQAGSGDRAVTAPPPP